MFHAAAFSPDGKRIIAGGVDHVARIFDTATGAEVLSLEGHADQIHGVAFSADGTRVVTTSADNTARVWDAAKGQHLATLRGHEFWVLNAAFSPDGNQVLTVAADKTARIWTLDTDSGEVMAFAPLSAAARNQGVSLSADGRQIFAPASGGFDVWNVQSSQLAETLDCLLCGRVRFSDPAKTRIVVLTPEGEIKDLKSGEKLGQVEGSFNGHEALLSAGGDRLMVRTKQDTETIYDIKSGKVLVQLTHACAAPTPGCGIWTAAFSQDGTRVVTSTNHRVVRVWDAASGKELFQKSVPGDPRSVTFSPDGKQLLVVNHGDVLLWDARNGAPLGTFSGHQNQVYSAAFNREGTRVVTTSVDRTIRIWDVSTVTELYRIDVDTIGMMYADFALDGTRIITTSLNTGAQLWRIPASTEKIIARAKERVTRCLTARQREVFHLTPDPPAWCRELKKWPYD
jgi:WD40 repeat protein